MRLKARIWSPRRGVWVVMVEDKIRVAYREPFAKGKIFSSWEAALDYSLEMVRQ